jgi:hypothetical protein
MVDTGDLKSPGHCGRTGSSPVFGKKTKFWKSPKVREKCK